VRLVHDSVTCCQGRPKPHVGCLSHEPYDSMVKVPLIMNKYAEEQSGWWQWMLHEIVHGLALGRDELRQVSVLWLSSSQMEAQQLTLTGSR
jgi:hypothetical protein